MGRSPELVSVAGDSGVGGGPHDMAFDSKGNVIFGMSGAIVRFDTLSHEFTVYPGGGTIFG